MFTWATEHQENLHYLQLLKSAGVPVEFISSPHPEFSFKELLENKMFDELGFFEHLNPIFSHDIWSVFTHLMVHRPKVLHCWLDYPNLIGGLAGWLAGVPKIIISTRNLNPTHFAYIYQPWYRTWYGLLAQCPRIKIISNSHVGAKSYASWLGISAEKITIVHNGLDLKIMEYPPDDKALEFRKANGIPADALLIAGVFRLNYEKRPSLFLRTIGELHKEFKNLHAVIAGIGPLLEEVEGEIERRGLTGVVHLLGRSEEIPTVMRASDLILLTSAEEGLPNVLMEAQWFSRPVIATDVGGSAEVVRHESTGFIVAQDDAAELRNRCRELLLDSPLRTRLGTNGRVFIENNFSLERMVDQTVSLY